MKPVWDKLMKNWNKEPRINTTLIGDVDCTAEGKPLCEQVGVQGYPTIKWGEAASNLQDYEGGRDYDALKKWAKENLKAMCNPWNIELCDFERRLQIEEMQKMSVEEMAKQYLEELEKIQAVEDIYNEGWKKLNVRHGQMKKDREAEIDAIWSSGLSLMQAVEAHARKNVNKEEL